MYGLVRINADDGRMFVLHGVLIVQNAQVSIRAGQDCDVASPLSADFALPNRLLGNGQAPMQSHLVRCRGDLTVDTSTQ